MKKFSVILCILFLFGSGNVFAAKLHTILVADTLDAQVGLPAVKDLQMIDTEMNRIAMHTELERHTYRFEGEDVVPEKLLTAIDGMHVESEDVIVFYFSGHGFRSFATESSLPDLIFSETNQAVSMNHIGRLLEAHKPRLLILLGDACNNYISELFAPTLIPKGLRSLFDEDILKENYKRLFLDPRGTIIAIAAKKGELSWSTKRGSLFTMAFLNQLNHAILSSSQVGWETIFELTAEQVKFDQHPDYQIYLEY